MRKAFSQDGLFSRNGMTNLGTASAFVFLSFAGVTKIAAVAGEIKSPSENLPKSMIWTLVLATAIYVLVSYFLLGMLEPSELGIGTDKPDKAPIHTFAVKVGGTNLGLLAAAVAIISMAGMALSGVLGSSRFIFAMSRDNLIPQVFEELNPKYETPHYAIVITGAAMAIAILTIPVGDVAKLASGFKIMIFMLINSTVIVLRWLPDGETWYTPSFKSPMFPAMQLFGVISGLILLLLMGITSTHRSLGRGWDWHNDLPLIRQEASKGEPDTLEHHQVQNAQQGTIRSQEVMARLQCLRPSPKPQSPDAEGIHQGAWRA